MLTFCAAAALLSLVTLKPGAQCPLSRSPDFVVDKSARNGATVKEPLIFIYNALRNMTDWNSRWANVRDSNVVLQLQNCPTACHFAFDKYFQRFADLVLVSLAGFSRWGGTRP